MDRSVLVERAWRVLIAAATSRKTLTYGELCRSVGYPSLRSVGNWVLEPIRAYCESNGLPALTSLVVRKGARRPGRGLLTHIGDDVEHQQQRVFAHKW